MRADVVKLCSFGIMTRSLTIGLAYRAMFVQGLALQGRLAQESARQTLVFY